MISKSDQQQIDERQTLAGRRLLLAVVDQAIRDACLTPLRGSPARPQEEALTAMRFFFDTTASGLAEYAAWLDMDPEVFKRKLLEKMRVNSSFEKADYNEHERRSFRFNYTYWCQHHNEANFYRKERAEQDDGPKQIWTKFVGTVKPKRKTAKKVDDATPKEEGKPVGVKSAKPARGKSGVAKS
jgi:hypothetical protein